MSEESPELKSEEIQINPPVPEEPSPVIEPPHKFSVGQEVSFNGQSAKVVGIEAIEGGFKYTVSLAAVMEADEDQLTAKE